jgi:hypothetical protein
MKHKIGSRNFRVALCAALLPLIAGCTPSVETTLKVTLSVEADGKLYSGSGIRKVICYDDVPELRGMSMGGCTTLGEAVVAVIGEGGDRGVLFLTVCYPGSGEVILQGRATSSDPNKWTIPIAGVTSMPQIMRFRNMGDVRTLMVVNPNDMAATMGKGVKFHSITVEQIASGEVTRGEVIKYLPWLEPLRAENTTFDMLYNEMFDKKKYGSLGSLTPCIFLGINK